MKIDTRRVYERPAEGRAFRVLVERLWPRGLTKEQAGIDLWLKAIAPSEALRTWFNHEARKWPQFRQLYFRELDAHRELVEALLNRAEHGTLILMYSAKDRRHNSAVALKDYLQAALAKMELLGAF